MAPSRSSFDRWIFDSYSVTPEGLGLYRIAYALFTLLIIAPGHTEYASFTFAASLPDSFFLPPPGPMQLAGGFPPELFFEGLHAMLALSLTAVLFGVYTRTASVATTLFFLIGYGFSYSLGKVNHNILFVLLPAGMALSNWGAAYSFDALHERTSKTVASWPLVLVALTIGFAMFTAGFPKILGGWLDPSTQAVHGRLVRQVFVHGRRDLLAPLAVDLYNPVLWEIFDVTTVLFEVGFLIAVVHPFTTRLFAVGAVAFHTGVLLVMNIVFTFNLIVYAAVLPWSRIAHALSPVFSVHVPNTRSRWSRLGLQGGLVLSTAAFFYAVGSPLLWLNDTVGFVSDLSVVDLIALVLAWSILLAVGILPVDPGSKSSELSASSQSAS
jgi:uncharacterized membrane protein YphA (DoxX/SURF4 family)